MFEFYGLNNRLNKKDSFPSSFTTIEIEANVNETEKKTNENNIKVMYSYSDLNFKTLSYLNCSH